MSNKAPEVHNKGIACPYCGGNMEKVDPKSIIKEMYVCSECGVYIPTDILNAMYKTGQGHVN